MGERVGEVRGGRVRWGGVGRGCEKEVLLG